VDRLQGWEEIHHDVTPKDLTISEAGLKYREIPANRSLGYLWGRRFRIYDLKAVLSSSKR
jgi:hypothetical protein